MRSLQSHWAATAIGVNWGLAASAHLLAWKHHYSSSSSSSSSSSTFIWSNQTHHHHYHCHHGHHRHQHQHLSVSRTHLGVGNPLSSLHRHCHHQNLLIGDQRARKANQGVHYRAKLADSIRHLLKFIFSSSASSSSSYGCFQQGRLSSNDCFQ